MRACEVCGCRVKRWQLAEDHPTCDNICAKAKRNRLTRGGQIEQDIIQDDRAAHTQANYERLYSGHAGRNGAIDTASEYNRPYLAVAAM